MAANQGQATLSTEDPEQIRAEIERTRRELGDTVAELAARADVRARSQERLAATRERAAETVRGSAPPLIAVGALVGAIALGVLFARRRAG